MTKAEELENVILGQIELLGDDSVFDDGEKLDRLIRRSDAMSALSENWIKIQQMKADPVAYARYKEKRRVYQNARNARRRSLRRAKEE